MALQILYIQWNCLCASDVLEALRDMGCRIRFLAAPKEDPFERNESFCQQVTEALQAYPPDAVFSMNFFPSVSAACEANHIPYLSWIYDNPQTAAYDAYVKNRCNYVFSFDSYMVKQLQQRGVEQVYYAPLAVNCKRLEQLQITVEQRRKYACQVAFVGSLYNEEHDYYSTFLARAQDEHFRGYLEGLLSAQKLVYGYNFLAEALTPEIMEVFHQAGAYRAPADFLLKEEEIYADVYLSRKLATINRMELLYIMGACFDVHLYTYKECPLPNVTQEGPIGYYEEMPKLFQMAKVNLNDTRRSIKNGIPLRAMEIMGAGGFLLSNYQEDFLLHFEPDKHMVLYSSLPEAVEKCDYYLKHEEQRQQIAERAHALMEQEHTYDIRLRQMFAVAGLL
jgi:spore maturation protein CgeB